MGSCGRRFGRNVPLEHTFPDNAQLLIPNPRVVSRELMTRRRVSSRPVPQPARSRLDSVHGARLVRAQALTHRGRHRDSAGAGRRLVGSEMRVPRSVPDPAPAGSTRPPAYANPNSHWWDASQIYGSDPRSPPKLRTGEGGKLKVESTNLLPVDPATGVHLTGFTDNWWIGLAMLHTLFTLRAQPHLRSAGKGASRLERRSTVRQGQVDQRRADGQDPHGRVDAGHRASSRSSRRAMHANWYGLPARAAGCVRVPERQRAARRHRRLEAPTITPRRTR